MGEQMITVNGGNGMITLSGLGGDDEDDEDDDEMGGTELKIGPDGTIMNMGDLTGMRHQVVAAEDGTVTLVVTEDLDEEDDDDGGQHQYSINGEMDADIAGAIRERYHATELSILGYQRVPDCNVTRVQR